MKVQRKRPAGEFKDAEQQRAAHAWRNTAHTNSCPHHLTCMACPQLLTFMAFPNMVHASACTAGAPLSMGFSPSTTAAASLRAAALTGAGDAERAIRALAKAPGNKQRSSEGEGKEVRTRGGRRCPGTIDGNMTTGSRQGPPPRQAWSVVLVSPPPQHPPSPHQPQDAQLEIQELHDPCVAQVPSSFLIYLRRC